MRKVYLATTLLVLACFSALSTSAVMSPSKRQKALERVRYIEYSGKQQDWPVSDAPMVEIENNKYGVPIYRNLPNKAYEVLGVVKAAGNSTIKYTAEAAQAVGANAILIVRHKAFSDAGINVEADMSSRGSQGGKIKLVEGILIRWKKE